MTEAGLRAARTALAGREAWLVGGAPRDRALGRVSADLDVVVVGDPAEAAHAVARADGRAACFALSEDFGAWRVVARDGGWQLDVEPMRGGSLEADLSLRDFTVNAIAEPIAGGSAIDPLGGFADLAARRLRMAGPSAFAEDPLRVLRLVRMVAELGFQAELETVRAAREHSNGLARVSAERVFLELRRIVAAPLALSGFALMGELGATAVVLPELHAMDGVGQSRFHHRDVHGHTLEVLEQTIALQRDPARILAGEPDRADDDGASTGGDRGVIARGNRDVIARGDQGVIARGNRDVIARGDQGVIAGGDRSVIAGGDRGASYVGTEIEASARAVAALLEEPLADGMTRGEALRWGALLHDVAKPLTRAVRASDGRVTFIGHDSLGAELVRGVFERLRASERLRAHVAALVRHHLRLGFLVHEPQPLSRRAVYRYLRACSPVEVDVTLLSVTDRLATRGDCAQEAIEAHLRVARSLLVDALRWRLDGPPAPLWRGDELARELAIATGPRLGQLLETLAEAQYEGKVLTRAQALSHARATLVAGIRAST